MEIVKEIILIILQAVIITAIPIVSKYIITWIKKEKQLLQDESESDYIDAVIERVGNLIIDVVTETTQTYVSALKKDNKFDVEQQKIAFNMSYQKIKDLLNAEYKGVIESVFGNVENYITTKIEATVAKNKIWQSNSK